MCFFPNVINVPAFSLFFQRKFPVILKPDVEAICLALDDASGAAPVEEEDVLPPQVAVAQHAEGV